MIKEKDSVVLAADANKNVPPKNCGGTRTRPENKLIGLIGLGAQATGVHIDLRMALASLNIIVPNVEEISGCTNAEEVNGLPIPNENEDANFDGSAIFIPAPAFRNAILATNIRDPFELIPLMTHTATEFDEAAEDAEEINGTTSTYTDALNAWLYGVK